MIKGTKRTHSTHHHPQLERHNNVINELLGVVANRKPNAEIYEQAEPALIAKLL